LVLGRSSDARLQIGEVNGFDERQRHRIRVGRERNADGAQCKG